MESATLVRRASLAAHGTLINQGVITADVSGQTLNISPTTSPTRGRSMPSTESILTLTGNVTNNGTIVVNAST